MKRLSCQKYLGYSPKASTERSWRNLGDDLAGLGYGADTQHCIAVIGERHPARHSVILVLMYNLCVYGLWTAQGRLE